MPNIIVFQHGDSIGPGRLGATLRDHGFHLDIRRPDRDGTRAIPPDLDDVDGVVSLGGHQNIGGPHPWMDAEIAFLREAHRRSRPLVGICLGHQLIAAALGGKVGPMDRYHLGFEQVRLNPTGQTDPVLAGIAWDSMQYEDHGDEVKELPPAATLLAGSAACNVEAFRAGLRTYAFQYHFEADRAMIEAWAAANAALLAEVGVTAGDLAAQCDRYYGAFARWADRLCVNIATYLFPLVARGAA
jgi:GMP synthase-like glutamine amidotransferase